jgi:4-diphosphocytidyl-2-C-methyl-D-erythritol kinase
MSTAPWPAPATLNHLQHVTGRRADGYHELQTLYQLVGLEDELSVRVRHDGVIALSGGPPGVAAGENLVERAARALRELAGETGLGADLVLRKRIPVGAGLGGGSSDAATTLVALNVLWRLDLSTDELAVLGRDLGADVPVFVRGENALAQGVGDRLAPIELPAGAFAIVYPGVAVSTAEAFQAPELTRNSPMITIPGFLLPGWPAGLPGRNDLEPVTAARHAPVRAALAWLGARGMARMTGSGAAVFAPYAERAAAEAAIAALPDGWSGYAVDALPRSPLLARLAAERASAGYG